MPQKARSPRNITIPDFCKSRAASASDHKPHSSRLLSRLLRQGPRRLHDPLPVDGTRFLKLASVTCQRRNARRPRLFPFPSRVLPRRQRQQIRGSTPSFLPYRGSSSPRVSFGSHSIGTTGLIPQRRFPRMDTLIPVPVQGVIVRSPNHSATQGWGAQFPRRPLTTCLKTLLSETRFTTRLPVITTQ